VNSKGPFQLLIINLSILIMNKIANYFKESFKELTEKVTWPTWPQLQQSTMIVLAATLVITFIVLAMDFVAGNSLKFIYKQLF
jgi:preprotein translocase subunit SecE